MAVSGLSSRALLKFLLRRLYLASFQEEKSEIDNCIRRRRGLCRSSLRKCCRLRSISSFGPQRLRNVIVNLRMRRLQLGGLHPAVNRLFVLPPRKQAVADIVIAKRTIRIYLLRQIKHLLGLLVQSHLRIGDYPVAVARLEIRVQFLNVLEGLNRQIILALSACNRPPAN